MPVIEKKWLWIVLLFALMPLTGCEMSASPEARHFAAEPGNTSVATVIAAPTSSPLGSPAALATRATTSRPTLAATVSPSVRPTSSAADPIVLAAGDIGVCGTRQDEATAKLLLNTPGPILALGDEAYPSGSKTDFANCYAPSWGPLKARTYPVPGNHEYATPDASGYYGYFGKAAGPSGKGYYSFDIGSWHLIALNSEIAVSAGSAQEQWLRADLAAHHNSCTLAFWHQPRFSSGPHGSNDRYQALWQALYESGADVVLNGHDHDYERFAPQAPDGAADPARGIREFVVGTGGASLYPAVLIAGNSEVRNNESWGVLKLTLHATGYDWTFLSIDSARSMDAGSGACH